MDTKTVQSTLQSPISQQLYLAFELSQKQWKLGFTVGMGQRPRIRTIQARDLQALQWEIQEARPDSYVDLLVEFDRPVGLFGLIALQQRLEELLGCPVDLGTPDSLKARIRPRVMEECVCLLDGGKNEFSISSNQGLNLSPYILFNEFSGGYSKLTMWVGSA